MNMENFGFSLGINLEDYVLDDEGEVDQLDEKYSHEIGTVIYEPKETNHKPSDLYTMDYERFSDLINKVEDGEIREMLLIRANWFAEFNFARVADYYAYQATKEEKRAFEALGLVLLDKDQLIENGFADAIEYMGAENE